MSGKRRILCNADDPQNYYYWVKLWQPYSGFPFLCDQGPHFPAHSSFVQYCHCSFTSANKL